MNKLQKLLDERWPLTRGLHPLLIDERIKFRTLFTEGYNARIAEEKQEREDALKLKVKIF